MEMVLACRELGFDCSFVAVGDTFKKMKLECINHFEMVHGSEEDE